MTYLHIALAAPEFIADHDAGDEHAYPPLSKLRACPECNAPTAPEPTDEERARLLADADFTWERPDDGGALYLEFGFGLMGGGYGPYACCDRCGWMGKEQVADGDE